MAKYLISFPSAAMVVPDGEWAAAAGRSMKSLDRTNNVVERGAYA